MKVDGDGALIPVESPARFVRLLESDAAWDGELVVGAMTWEQNPGWVDDPRDRRVVARWLPARSMVLWARVEDPAGRDALAGFAPAPTLVLADGSARTALWALAQPLSRRWTVDLNKRLAHRVGAKKLYAERWFEFAPPGAVLRAGRGRPVAVGVEAWTGELHSARAVAGGLVDPPDPRAAWKAMQEREET